MSRPAREVALADLKGIIQELDQVLVAVSVIGATSRRKLDELTNLVTPVANSIVGARRDVRTVRGDLIRAIHNMSRGNTSTHAEKNMRAVLAQLVKVEALAKRGLALVPTQARVSHMNAINSWGYSEKDIEGISRRVHVVSELLGDVGLFRKLVYGDVVLQPDAQDFATYNRTLDIITINASGKFPSVSLTESYALRMWYKLFGDAERKAWGNQHVKRFVGVFSDMVAGKKSNDVDFARLLVTAGKFGDVRRMKMAVKSNAA